MTSRLFLAVIPPSEVMADLEKFAEPRMVRDDPLRWSDPLRWHVSLAFMPAASASRYDDLVESLELAVGRRATFEISFAGAGTFPDPFRAKVLWLGVAGDLDALSNLATACRTAASRSGVAVDGAQFRPHLTLARANPPLDMTRWLRVFDLYRGSNWRVEEVQLIESHLGQRGRRTHAEHQVREVISLG